MLRFSFPEADIGNGAQHFGEPMAATRTFETFAVAAPKAALDSVGVPANG
jgi:hypothetical protein